MVKVKMRNTQQNKFSTVEGVDSFCDACSNQSYKCKLQTRYTYLENNIDTKNGLLSQMFEKRVLTLKEKQSIERLQCNQDRNRRLVDIFLEFKTHMHYMSFLECLVSTNQSHITMHLENLKSCSSYIPQAEPSEASRADLLEVGHIAIPREKAVIGLCTVNNNIYFICHKNPRIFVFSMKSPFMSLSHLEIKLPVDEDTFHFYDMISMDNGYLIISDKALPGFWMIRVEDKLVSKLKLKDVFPYRMFVSHFVNHNSRLNVHDFNDLEESDTENNVCNSLNDDQGDCEANLFRSFDDANIYSADISLVTKANKETFSTNSSFKILVTVLKDRQYLLHIYSNPVNLVLEKELKLDISHNHTISNLVQKSDDGDLLICVSKVDFRKFHSSEWYLSRYSPTGQLLTNYHFNSDTWVPRYISLNHSQDPSLVYVVSRFSNEIYTIDLKAAAGNSRKKLKLKRLNSEIDHLYLPSRITFTQNCLDYPPGLNNLSNELDLLLVGQGEIDDDNHSAISIMKLV
ncbi:hypothetical protein HELRODRAFT_169681 [Helobdella robusta]|uniref:CARD domain-containing protein n=1 Tax=Helobdella robusta TaxID=6412 RepID=T1F280_HELRO|nr:hypothetical protein HELRODRAFT_169681 [Helobdella robusta]ESO07966.1 hypothetical protein HELRODRAFT_169681 [Helobdella robusta]